jgi:hypothetical protein
MNNSSNLFMEKIEILELKIESLELKIESLESKIISLEEKNSEYIKEISNRFIKITEKLIILSDNASIAKVEKFNRNEEEPNVALSTNFTEVNESIYEDQDSRIVFEENKPYIKQDINEQVKKIFSK